MVTLVTTRSRKYSTTESALRHKRVWPTPVQLGCRDSNGSCAARRAARHSRPRAGPLFSVHCRRRAAPRRRSYDVGDKHRLMKINVSSSCITSVDRPTAVRDFTSLPGPTDLQGGRAMRPTGRTGPDRTEPGRAGQRRRVYTSFVACPSPYFIQFTSLAAAAAILPRFPLITNFHSAVGRLVSRLTVETRAQRRCNEAIRGLFDASSAT